MIYLYNLLFLTFIFFLVRSLQTIILDLGKENDKRTKNCKRAINSLYSDFEQQFGISKAPLNILRGSTILFSLRENKIKKEFQLSLNKIINFYKPNTLAYISKRFGVILIHSVIIITIALTIPAERLEYLWVATVTFAIFYVLTQKMGKIRAIFTLILFLYLGLFAKYTVVYYIIISRVFKKGAIF